MHGFINTFYRTILHNCSFCLERTPFIVIKEKKLQGSDSPPLSGFIYPLYHHLMDLRE